MKKCNKKSGSQPADAGQAQADQVLQMLKQNQLPTEQISDTELLASSHQQAKQLNLKRGQYRITGWVAANEYQSYEQFKRDLTKLIPQGAEKKRVHFHKIDVGERQEIKKDGDDYLAHPYTLVFTVVDNPIPVVPIIWGASIIGSATAGWFFVDKVEAFTETSSGKLITVAASLATIAGLYLAFKN